MVLYLWLFPAKWFGKRFNKIVLLLYFFVIIATLIANAISEFIFWEEFSVRFNFIAVDYLVYTTEVIGNIRQSYPINTILAILFIVSALLTYGLRNLIWQATTTQTKFKQRSKLAMVILLAPLATYFLVNHKWKTQSDNQYVNELSGNGMYDFGFAFWHNELDYDTFYKTLPVKDAVSLFRKTFIKDSLQKTGSYSTRNIVSTEKPNQMNVVL
ncbi:MAG: LTA synthase family protein, partial [Pedobacter sp.]